VLINSAFLFHGEQILPILIAALLVTIAILAVSAYLLVRVFRSRLGRRSILVAPLPFLLFAALIWFWVRTEAPNSGPPQLLSPARIPGIIHQLPDYAPFSFAGAAYFRDHLYVGTNIGLLQIDDVGITNLYQMQKKDSVVSGPWSDQANRLLWVKDEHTGELLNFDGVRWRRVPMPMPSKGYYSRGDVLAGIKPVGNAQGFWMAAAGSAWRWSAIDAQWIGQRGPELSNISDSVIGVIPMEEGLAYIVRHEPLSFLNKPDEELKSDTVVFISKSGAHELTNLSGTGFLAESWAAAHSAGYVCDRTGKIRLVTVEAIKSIESPGICEAMTANPDGNLVASFRGQGIFRLDGHEWRLLSTAVPKSGHGDYWVYLAVGKNQTAYVMSAQPVIDKQRTTRTDMHFTQNAETAVWVIRGTRVSQVRIN